MVQEPETSFEADVPATERVLNMQDGPPLLVGHSYGGSIVTEARVGAWQENAEHTGQDRRSDQDDAGAWPSSNPPVWQTAH
jgi:hypothetical protein